MDDRLINKFISAFKRKFVKKKGTYSSNSEYAFSIEELENINKQNKQKIQELKQDIFTSKKEKNKPNSEEVLSKIEPVITQEHTESDKEDNEKKLLKSSSEINEELANETIEELQKKGTSNYKKEPLDELVKPPKNSFIKLSEEHQKLVMDNWNKIKPNKIDKDIIDAKDLLNHNYTRQYADEATKFIQYVRKEYEVVICYLIGFNNEKQGIFDKTIFSDKMDNEWKHLNKYIKILEKIRNFKK